MIQKSLQITLLLLSIITLLLHLPASYSSQEAESIGTSSSLNSRDCDIDPIVSQLTVLFQESNLNTLKLTKKQWFRNSRIHKKPDMIQITFMGDICLGSSYGTEGKFKTYFDNNGPDYFFQHVRDLYSHSDYVIANMENVFTDCTDYQEGKIYTYKADPKYLEVLAHSGITHVAVVNNHMHDYCQAGFEDSINRLEEIDIDWFGSMSDLTGTDELGSIDVDKKVVLEQNDFKVGLLSYYGFYGSYRTEEDILADIESLKSEGVDYVIAYVHWGGQNDHHVVQRQIEYGHLLIDLGVDCIIGGHPHVVQNVEVYKEKHIYYSLGDFLFFPRSKPVNPDGLMVQLSLHQDESGKIKEMFSNIPVLWGGSETENLYSPVPTTDGKALQRVAGFLQ